MLSLPRVCMLVKGGAVEFGQGMSIPGEMGWYPVQQHPDTLAVQVIDQIAEIVRRAETAGRGEIAGALIAPGGVQGMFGNR